VVCAGEMTIRAIKRAKELISTGQQLNLSDSLHYFLSDNFKGKNLENNRDEILEHFSNIDDTDILMALKGFSQSDDFVLSYLSKSLVSRKLFRVAFQNEDFEAAYIEEIKTKVLAHFPISEKELDYFVFSGKEANKAYVTGKKEIMIKLPKGEIRPISEWSEHNIRQQEVVKYFACYPKSIE
jgi:hypothetical protein